MPTVPHPITFQPIQKGRPVFARAVLVSLVLVAIWFVSIASAYAETRTLRMYFTHTKESATITFKRNGRYVQSGLRKANRFLRDWRRKEPTRMDPELLDLVWEVYQKSGSKKPIHVVSGYRSPRTNKMLRRRGRGVARKSQHTLGKALDFFLPDVKPSKLRAIGLRMHRGGVGYYRGGFVHLDTGRVRHWPRMSRRQLARVFPRGRTIHVPTNGKPLRGYKTAMANLKRGLNADGSRRGTTIRGGTSLLARLFQGGGRTTDDDGDIIEAAKPKSNPRRKPEPQSAPEPVAVAKAEPPKLERKRGNDPFATEAEAVGETQDDAAQQLVAALPPSRIAIPIRRPGGAVAPSVAPADRPAVAAATELALASPPATRQILKRPSLDVPSAVESPTAVLARAQTDERAAQLKQRVTTALAQKRNSTVAQRAAEALVVPSPRANVGQQNEPQIRLASLDLEASGNDPAVSARQLAARLAAQPTQLGATRPSEPLNAVALQPLERAAVETFRPQLDEAVVLAALSRSSANTNRANVLGREAAEALRQKSSQIQTASVPLPRPEVPAAVEPKKPKRAVAAPQRPVGLLGNATSSNIKSELALGDLDGNAVKEWAVATSTRIGPLAQLRAPTYKSSVTRLAPNHVLGDGFTNKRQAIRADRFTGKSLARTAFARLASL
ncbi:MAG: DUF882 domain-containing protein [Ahrensia sp.]|nr:DUF882 domain-containing protein [Ahrensia sp.]